MRALARILAAAALALLALHAGAAARAATNCATSTTVTCSTVDVPLDRSGRVPGTIGLHVEVLRSESAKPRGVVFLVAGGPGQGSAATFDFGVRDNASFYRLLFPGYTLVAYDDRGTGCSGLLECASLRTDAPWDEGPAMAASCAGELGARGAFYGTDDHAEDLEAVRAALGFDRIAIWGVSYGTKLALAYAQAHPEHVERLLLDSVLPADGPDPFDVPALQAMPATLASYCAGGACAAATPDFAGDVVALANALAAKPLVGRVRTASGGTRTQRLAALDFLGLVTDADLNPGLAAELPADVRAARAGDPRPLLRAVVLDAAASAAGDVSYALYLATVCHDGPFPWRADTPVPDRPGLVQAALAALPPGSFGAFGPWAAGFGGTSLCGAWPSPAGDPVAPAPVPDVPLLAVSGGLDLRTPTAGAAATVARFPHGRLLVVPGVGHSVLTADPSGCSQRAVRTWVLGGAPPAACARPKAYLPAVPAFPRAVPARATAAQARALAVKTIRDAEAVWLTAASSATRLTAAGLAAGKLVAGSRSFTLDRYAIVPGLELSGKVALTRYGPPLAFSGSVRVRGRATGSLVLGGTTVAGRLRVP